MIQHLTKETFLNEVFNYEKNKEWKFEGEKPCIIDFYADWCGPCKIQDPILEKLENKFGDKIEFKKINVDDNLQLANKYGIRVVPTLILECNGKIIEHYIGVTRPEILEADLNKAAESCSE